MTAARGITRNGFDERLVRMRDSMLVPGEEVRAEQVGDRGQAIVLTNSHVMVLKAGLVATGTLDGEKACTYPYSEIKCVRLRRGPMGAALHVLSDVPSADASRPPDSMVVFSGDALVKKCEAIAVKIEAALGRPIERIGFSLSSAGGEHPSDIHTQDASEQDIPTAEPAVEVPKVEAVVTNIDAAPAEVFRQQESQDSIAGVTSTAKARNRGAKRQSLAEEIYADIVGDNVSGESVQGTTSLAGPASRKHAKVAVVEALTASVDDPLHGHNPNPNIPPSVRRRSSHSSSMSALVCALAIVLVVGVAIIGRPQKPVSESKLVVSVMVSMDRETLEARLKEIAEYDKKVREVVNRSTEAANTVMMAVRSGSVAALRNASAASSHDIAFTSLRETTAPSGLVDAHEWLQAAVVERKMAITSISSEIVSKGSVDTADVVPKLAHAHKLIQQAFTQVDMTENFLRDKLKSTATQGTKVKAVYVNDGVKG